MNLVDTLWQDSNRMSGAVCFRNTRIPISVLFDYLEAGSVDDFLRNYPDVTREQVQSLLESSRDLITHQFEHDLAS